MELSLSKMRQDLKLIRKSRSDVAFRLSALIELEKINLSCKGHASMAGKRMKLTALCEGLEVSLRTLQRWRSAYLKRDLFGIAKKKAKGAKKQALNEESCKLIEQMRSEYRWGPEVIQAHLKYDHGIKLSQYKINKYLNDSGLRDKYPCIEIKKRRKTKKHDKVVKVLIPGAHTQMDVNHQPNLLNKKSYIYNFVDHASNWSFKRAYNRVSPDNTVDFLRRILKICPFKIYRLQTDNGVEFTYKYISKYEDEPVEHPIDRLCIQNNIVHKLIPPGEKELQGLVERSHRQDKQELLYRIKPQTLEEFNGELSFYFAHRNKARRFKKLGWMTPNESLSNFLVSTLVSVLIYKRETKDLSKRKYRRKKAVTDEILNNKKQVKVIKEVLRPQKEKKVA